MSQLATWVMGTLLAMVFLTAPAVRADERWAAIASDDDAESPVVWADNKDDAIRRALVACKKNSDTCGDRPATTNDMSHIFTVMCCTKPRHGCAIGVDKSKEDSLAMVQKVFDDAGYASCKVLRRMSAQNGRKLSD